MSDEKESPYVPGTTGLLKMKFGGHSYAPDGTSDCAHGCGCWCGPTRSGGPDGIDPMGTCPKNPITVEECRPEDAGEETWFDSDGQQTTLDALCRKEPAWAANRIRAEIARAERLQDAVDATVKANKKGDILEWTGKGRKVMTDLRSLATPEEP